MVSYTPSGRIKDIKYYAWAVYENQYPTNLADTFTCSEFVTAENLAQALLVNNSTGAEIATTIALNVVTVSGASANTECTLFVFGRRT